MQYMQSVKNLINSKVF